MGKHLVFYDGTCSFCSSVVQFILRADRQKIFLFTPLQGETAARLLKRLPAHSINQDSLVLLENYQKSNEHFYILGKAALRILWLLGGWYACLGWISFLPSFFYDWFYKLIARYRYQLFSGQACKLKIGPQDPRFLP